MDIKNLLPVISQLMGRDLSAELAMFDRTKAAIGAALNQEGQIFVSQAWQGIPAFLETAEGKKAIAAFMDAWVAKIRADYEASIPKQPVVGQEPT